MVIRLVWHRSRCPVTYRGIVTGIAPLAPHRKKAGDLKALLACEKVAAMKPKLPFLPCHAAGWVKLFRGALRYEQSIGTIINAIVDHVYHGRTFHIVSSSILKDKNPDKRKQRSRPLWCVIDSIDGSSCVVDRLTEMLDGLEGFRGIIRDTNSLTGDSLLPR